MFLCERLLCFFIYFIKLTQTFNILLFWVCNKLKNTKYKFCLSSLYDVGWHSTIYPKRNISMLWMSRDSLPNVISGNNSPTSHIEAPKHGRNTRLALRAVVDPAEIRLLRSPLPELVSVFNFTSHPIKASPLSLQSTAGPAIKGRAGHFIGLSVILVQSHDHAARYQFNSIQWNISVVFFNWVVLCLVSLLLSVVVAICWMKVVFLPIWE